MKAYLAVSFLVEIGSDKSPSKPLQLQILKAFPVKSVIQILRQLFVTTPV